MSIYKSAEGKRGHMHFLTEAEKKMIVDYLKKE